MNLLNENSVDDKLFLSLTKSSRMLGKYIGVIVTGFVLFLSILYASTLNATFHFVAEGCNSYGLVCYVLAFSGIKMIILPCRKIKDILLLYSKTPDCFNLLIVFLDIWQYLSTL